MASQTSPPRLMVGISTKMYFSLQKTTSYIQVLTTLAPHALSQNIDLFIIPDFLSLAAASTILHSSAPSVLLGAQNCFWEDSGPFTGEISPSELKALGCSIVELGHAERRRIFGETDEMVAKKVRGVVRNGMVPLVCIGEKEKGTIESAVGECRVQVQSVLDIITDSSQEIIFAYEPVWAIGQSSPAPASHVIGVIQGLRKLCEGKRVRFLYGGSAGPGTYEKLKGTVDGLFLGRFGHDIERVREVLEEVGGR